MAEPLTKEKKNGELYVRLPHVDAQIDEMVSLDLGELTKRLSITNPHSKGFLASETLIHLIRKALREANKDVVDAVIRVLFIRCEANLRKQVSHTLPNAEKIREDALAELGAIIARDGAGKVPNRLDLFEWRFNLQFKSLRLDAIKRETKAVNRAATISEDSDAVELADFEAAFEKLAGYQTNSNSNVVYAPSPEDQLIARDIYKVIYELPKDERNAFIAVQVMGLTEKQAGKQYGVSDRTIRTRKQNAIAKLRRQKENL